LRFASYFNQYFQKKEPWSNIEAAPTTLFISINAVRSLAILLLPFIPQSAEKIWMQLMGTGGENQSLYQQNWDGISKLKIKPGHQIGEVKPLFKKIEKKEIETEKTKLGA
jgi:methionyl-tRNA synthetase